MTATTTLSPTPPRHSDRPISATPPATQLGALVTRNLRTTARVPQLLMFSLTMPMAMLVLFSQVFRSVADGPDFPAGVDYIDFITPAMLAVATVMAGTNVGVAAAIDHTNGLHDRFRTLAMPRACPASPARSTKWCSPSPAPRCSSVRLRCCSASASTATDRRHRRPRRADRPRRRDERPVRPDR